MLGVRKKVWQRALLASIFLIGLSLLPATVVSAETPPPRPSPRPLGWIRVLTYNIHYGESPDTGRQNLDRIAQHIRNSGADIVALQEVDQWYWTWRSNCVNQAHILAQMTGMQYVYGPQHTPIWMCASGLPSSVGNVILSRYPISSPTLLQTNGRKAGLRAHVNVDNVRSITVWSNHFSHNFNGGRTPEAVTARTQEAQALRADIIAQQQSRPFFVALGDYNAGRGEPELEPLRPWLFTSDGRYEGIDFGVYPSIGMQLLSTGKMTDPYPRPSDHQAVWADFQLPVRNDMNQ